VTVGTVFSNIYINLKFCRTTTILNIQTLKNALCKRSTLLMKYQRCKLYLTYALYT